jgi:hypothetical protein
MYVIDEKTEGKTSYKTHSESESPLDESSVMAFNTFLMMMSIHPFILLSESYYEFKFKRFSLVLVAHTCNPSHLGDRDQEDHSLNPALANSS